MRREWHSLSELRQLRRKWSVFAFLSRLERNKTSEHSFNTTFSVCIPSLNPPARKSHNQTKRMLKKRKQGTAAKYTHKRVPFWWYLQSLCEKERKWGSPVLGRRMIYKCLMCLWLSSLKFCFAFTQSGCFSLSWSTSTPAEVTIF